MSESARRIELVDTVPLLDLKAPYAPLRKDFDAAIREVCDSQCFVTGPKVAQLEEEVAAYGNTGYGIRVSSGTDAIPVYPELSDAQQRHVVDCIAGFSGSD